MSITIRTATLADVDALAALNRAAYPDLVQDGVVFDALQMRGHQERFPEGQLVAELDGEIVGAIATMISPRELDPLAPHTWMGITDAGSFARHDDGGDTLYLADIYVHQRAWGTGAGRALYAALFNLCRKLALANVVGGGRLYDYIDAPATLAPTDYVAQVVRGLLRPRSLARLPPRRAQPPRRNADRLGQSRSRPGDDAAGSARGVLARHRVTRSV